MLLRRLLVAAFLVLCASSNTFAADPSAQLPLEVLRVTPEGEGINEDTNTVVIQFSRAAVPLGRMDRTASEIGVTISPSLPCQWRWTDTSTLSCFLPSGGKMAAATRYKVTVKPQFDTTVREALKRPVETSFTTELPGLLWPWITAWKSPTEPVVTVNPSLPVAESDLSEHLVFQAADGKRTRAKLVKPQPPAGASAAASAESGKEWLATPAEPLAPDTSYKLLLTKGLRASVGELALEKDREFLSLHTFPAFELLGIGCVSLKGDEVFIPVGEPAGSKKRERCDPLNRIALQFSVPVVADGLATGVEVTPALTKDAAALAELWREYAPEVSEGVVNSKGMRYPVPLPYGLRAISSYTVQAKADGVRDMFGRTLPKEVTLAFATDHRLPRMVLDHEVSVLEKEVDTELPIVVNNVSAVDLSYRTIVGGVAHDNLSKSYKPYDVQDIAYAYPIGVRELLGGRSGLVQGTMSTVPKTSEEPRVFFSQVTPFAVHAKLGHFSSLVWVTSLATGLPIQGAKVSIVEDTLSTLSATPKVLAAGETGVNGVSLLPGSESIDPQRTLANVWERNKPRLMFRVEQGEDIALVPIGYEFEVYGEGIWPSTSEKYGHLRAWGTTAQGLYKAGDSVQFSLWVRNQDDKTLTSAPRGEYTLEVSDPLGQVVYTVPGVQLSEFGGFHGEMRTAPSSAVGWYTFTLKPQFSKVELSPLRVLISDFTPAPFKVSSRLDRALYKDGDAAKLITEARLHAGGPYADAPVRVSATVEATRLVAADPNLSRFDFGFEERSREVFSEVVSLNAAGDNELSIAIPEADVPYGVLRVESAVKDDRGKSVATVAKAPYVEAERFAGLAFNGWYLQAGKEEQVEALVIGPDRAAAAGTALRVVVERKETKVSRVKSAGNAYLPKVESTWVSVAECSLVSGALPVPCRFTPPVAGDYRVTASVKDARGREHKSEISLWAAGRGFVAWDNGSSTALSVSAEKASYKVGDVARFVVKNPFPSARALFTTERYGIISSWTKELTDGVEVVEVPVTPDHIPGFFFSAVLTSPRVDKPIEGQVDLGKPTFRMGYVAVDVTDAAKQLTVEVKPSAPTYKPREKVRVDLAARGKGTEKAQVQFAVTVLDEAVFDLLSAGRANFDPYKGFYTMDGLDVENFNLLRFLIGRQKFEKKGASPGGDGGGKLDMRSLQKYVGYWNPALPASPDGSASFTFDAPDNLTGWKVFAMAFTKSDQMGLGEGAFGVNKNTELRAALPNIVRQGDTFSALFTVMNRTDAVRDIAVTVRSEAGALAGETKSATVKAEPFKRVPVTLALSAKAVGEGTLVATASDLLGEDGLTAKVAVLPSAQVTTSATFGSSDGAAVTQPISFPAEMRTDMGSVGVVLSPSVLGALDGAFEYMRDYPYDCWEQKLSKGVMALNYLSLRGYLSKGVVWDGARETAQTVLNDMATHQAPSGGMCYYSADDERVDLYLSAYTALALTWMKDGGLLVPAEPEAKLLQYLEGVLRNDSSAARSSAEMRSSVRAVVLAALARRGMAKAADLQRVKPALKEMSIFGRAAFLDASVSLGLPDAKLKEVYSSIAAAGRESSGKLAFVERVDTGSGYMLDSAMRTQCAVLSSYLTYAAKSAEGKRLVEPQLPKIVRGITLERKRKDRWENTQENLFCTSALAQYARLYEASEPKLSLSASVGGETIGTASFQSVRSEAAELSRPLRTTDAGKSEELAVTPQGTGRYYYSTRLSYAPKGLPTQPTIAGMELRREYSVRRGAEWKLLTAPVALEQGEVVKVDLFLRLSGPKNFVVVDDPVPGGLEPVNRDLATSSQRDAAAGAFVGSGGSFWFTASDWIDYGDTFWSFYHKELRNSAARFYSSYLPAGNYHLSYTAQAIAPGEFVALPARAEEMYDPDSFGLSAGDRLVVSAGAGGQ